MLFTIVKICGLDVLYGMVFCVVFDGIDSVEKGKDVFASFL